ncbi:acyl-CoA dehydrogenase [Mycobacteroides abscessus]|uniref:acyl-CoA dehydrogenase n=1 Tax=Mycobacteroides abscessus TaxID=36809 RepID=UPI0002DDD1A6|nr:acyl-CoA dehydrogenase [Mycobacteroides abscessus]MDO2968218.1 acyl-CoA dehydrogenase [Mycobacteroides abscessus subsp. bolletii]MDO3080442.1 acyl-CoA dehydrogenase [Mycobacteroides abscessus subsp. bolletii]RIT96792.1 acyl-CoA dehydrogenase [Mycobacteroides abscessus]SKK53583.1 acyl-CoA dehydrogenase [Mycobacteroides abscessus subsp. bolletii]
MKSTLLSRADLDFLLFEWLRVDELTKRERFSDHSADTFGDVLTLCEQIAERYFAPHNKRGDTEEPSFDGTTVTALPDIKEAIAAFAAADLIGMVLDEKHGGAQLPATVATAGFMWMQAANVATAGYPMLTMANAHLLTTYGTDAQIQTFVAPMLDGRFTGTMCLSEPHAGSSLADITTRAEPQPDGTYRLFGTKMWISAGDHELTDNIVHLVLAKLPGAPAGVKGISLFIVPKHLVDEHGATTGRNDVVTAGLNHKMGQRGLTNALLNFGEGAHEPDGQPGAIGYLVGEPHKGLAYMFHMMNEERLTVGAAATALGYTGYLKSLHYAHQRPQGRPASSKDPAAPPVPIIEHADVKRMLIAQKAYVEGALALLLYSARLTDFISSSESSEDADDAALLLDLLTPIAKAWPSKWCLEANNMAIQVYGGYGYTREYDVEQHYRDNRLNAIHEGTNGIQGIDLLGRKVRQRDGAALTLLDDRIFETVNASMDIGGEPAELGSRLRDTWLRVKEVTAVLVAEDDIDASLANSSIYLDAFGHTVIAWLWLEQVLAAHDRTGDFYDAKRHAARYFYRYELPVTATQLDLLGRVDRTMLDLTLPL